MDLECFSCFIKSLLSALWLVDDSAAVSLRFVLTRDRMTTFLCFSVSSFCCSSCCLPRHLMDDTCALMDIRTSQAITPAVHIHVSPILTCCIVENPRKWCPVFHSPSSTTQHTSLPPTHTHPTHPLSSPPTPTHPHTHRPTSTATSSSYPATTTTTTHPPTTTHHTHTVQGS